MKIDRFINRILEVFGLDAEGGNKVWFHSQNLNEDKHGEARWPPYHGRWWLHFGHKYEIHFSWNLWTHFCGIEFSFDPSEDGWCTHWAFPPFSFWFSTNFLSKGMKHILSSERVDKWSQKTGGHPGSSRYTKFHFIDIRIFNWAFWWEFLKFDWGWSSRMPKWMVFTFHFDDFILGKMKYTEKLLEERDMVIQMPEGEYKAKGKLVRAIRKRPRWFGKPDLHITVDIPKGIPHQGKGENSWDCGTDGLFGYGYSGDNWREAADRGTQIVLESRKKYDGNRMAKYPAPLDNSDLNALLVEAGKSPVSPAP